MSFKMNLSPTYFWPVTATVPIDGKKQPLSFDAEFKRLKQSEVVAAFDRLNNDASDRDIAPEILVGWKGIQDENGNEIEFSESVRDALLEIPGMPSRIVVAWVDSLKQGDQKN